MSDLLRRSDVLDILGNVFATTLNVDVDAAIAAMMCKIKYMPKVEPDDTTEAYNKGLEDGRNEVWEMAKKIILDPQDGGLSIGELKKMFGFGSPSMILIRYTMQEALAKLEAYEKEQAEIKVGDVFKLNHSACCVIQVGNEMAKVIWKSGNTGNFYLNFLKKQAKKGFIDIQSVLQQIGG